jgi:hypothetical protein
VKAVTAFMVLVAIGTAGICVYVSVSSYYLTTNIMTQFQTLIGNSGGGGPSSNPMQNSTNGTNVKFWLPFPINNSGTVGMDIKDLVLNVTMTLPNGTFFKATTEAGTIPFGSSKIVNIMILDTTIFDLLALNITNPTITLNLQCAMKIALPSSWGLFALDMSKLEFGLTIPEVQVPI